MPEPFKNLISPDSMARLADGLVAGTPDFPRDAFHAGAAAGLEALELKDRVRHVAGVLRAHLPGDWEAAVGVLLRGSGPPLVGEEGVASGFHLWPLLTVVEEHGLAHPEVSLAALQELTKRFSAEFAVRPYLITHPDLTFAVLNRWCDDPDPHVRRLVSEGSRPRLPWGQQLAASIADPSRGIALLERLVDAPERYVQRSVANHLNDIARDHPDRAAGLARAWSAVPGRAWIVRHGLRTLVKAGHTGALDVLGFGPPKVRVTHITASPSSVALGDGVRLRARIVSTAKAPQRLAVDLVLGLVRQRGERTEKVLKGAVRVLDAGARWDFDKRIPLKPVTTRRYYPGEHTLTVQINGVPMGTARFMLTV
jgi:3-methyladenine DNA glycosylase AlkC